MTPETAEDSCSKKNVITEIQVVIEPGPYHRSHYFSSQEDKEKRLKEWANEVQEFVRDHRSCDIHSVDVVTHREDVCSRCGCEWETEEYEEDGLQHCVGCGRVAE